ncbi:MAG: TMEM175 family protein [Acidobacteriota bacterium]|nr:TMEM175 family protein [Acidobacteriota bacterium]
MSNKQTPDSILSTQRHEYFSDSVFAIVRTLLFIELRVPEINNVRDWTK